MFHRESVSMNGDLTWTTKNRLGRRAQHHSFVRTSNLSLDGGCIHMAGELPFVVGAKARLQLDIAFCEVRVLDVVHKNGNTILRINFMAPTVAFVSMLESHLPRITTGRELHEGQWL